MKKSIVTTTTVTLSKREVEKIISDYCVSQGCHSTEPIIQFDLIEFMGDPSFEGAVAIFEVTDESGDE